MPIKFSCTSCKKTLTVADSNAGKKGKCPKCGSPNVIPSSSVATSAGALVAGSKPNPKNPSVPAAAKGKPASPPSLRAATPVAAPKQPLTQSPYATPQAPAGPQNHVSVGGNGLLQQIFMPLKNNLFYIRAASWLLLIYGGICAITIVGIIIAWLPIWMGITLRKFAAGIENGYATGNSQEFASANKNLSTYFAILGVLAMIGFVIVSIYLLILFAALAIGFVAALSQ